MNLPPATRIAPPAYRWIRGRGARRRTRNRIDRIDWLRGTVLAAMLHDPASQWWNTAHVILDRSTAILKRRDAIAAKVAATVDRVNANE